MFYSMMSSLHFTLVSLVLAKCMILALYMWVLANCMSCIMLALYTCSANLLCLHFTHVPCQLYYAYTLMWAMDF